MMHEGREVFWLTDSELAREIGWWPRGVPLPVKAWRSGDWATVRYLLGTEVV